MAKIVRSVTNADNVPTVVHLPVGASQTIEIGDLVQIDGSTRKLVVAAAASTTLVGIAQEAITTGSGGTDREIPVVLIRNQVVRIPFATGGSKTTFADTDKYTTAYDLGSKNSVNPDDTTGGMCYIQDYNNTDATVDVVFASANLANIG